MIMMGILIYSSLMPAILFLISLSVAIFVLSKLSTRSLPCSETMVISSLPMLIRKLALPILALPGELFLVILILTDKLILLFPRITLNGSRIALKNWMGKYYLKKTGNFCPWLL